MKIDDILKQLPFPAEFSALDITGLHNDSRKIKAGDLFIAYPGAATDGRNYIQSAIDKGAAAIFYDPLNFRRESVAKNEIPLIAVANLEQKLAEIAQNFYQNPSTKLFLCGVTGTNGKTTIAYQLAQAYSLLGKQVSYIGTLGEGAPHHLRELLNTTPDILCLQRLLHEYLQQHIKHVCMEVSSHALEMGRVADLSFDQAIFTNLTLDHLDYHKTMENYAKAKAKLFAMPTLRTAIFNADDAYTSQMQEQLPISCQQVLYGLHSGCDVFATHWNMNRHGSIVEVKSVFGNLTLQLNSIGKFNLYNSLAVFAALLAAQAGTLNEIAELMGELKPAPGRMEMVSNQPCVVVDYAHTPDALENVLQALLTLKHSKLWVVFGCGGDRDHSKRSVMGAIAAKYADVVIVTNDNPRTEDPDAIIKEILQGIPSSTTHQVIQSRREAIAYTLTHAKPTDIILIAGKGHENYQIIGKEKQHFSDQEEVSRLGFGREGDLRI